MSVDWRPLPDAWLHDTSLRFGIAPALMPDLALAVPELLFATWSPNGAFNRTVRAWRLDHANVSSCRAVFVFHSLSPLGDTALLLASLGSAHRVATLLGRPLVVALTDVDIAEHNRMVRTIGTAHLQSNRSFRLWLYDLVGADVHLASLSNLPNIAARELRAEAAEIESWCREFGSAVGAELTVRLNGEPRRDVDAKLAMLEESERGERRGRISIVRSLLRGFGQVDQETVHYFLAQRYHQHAFADCLKLAICKERSFDEPAILMDSIEYGAPRGISRALYVSDYLFGHSYRTRMGLHPYCFPSGTAFDRLQSPEMCRRMTIHLNDIAEAPQIRRAFSQLSYPEDARFLADLLSFAHLLRAKFRSSEDDTIFGALASALPEWGDAWRMYAVAQPTFGQLARAWFYDFTSGGARHHPAPYYVYPYVLLQNREQAASVVEAAIAVVQALARSLAHHPAYCGARLPS